MAYRVWIFGDLPMGRAAGPSYMVESWQRELRRQGIEPRTFTPSTGLRSRTRSASTVTFRTVRHVGYMGDYHARFSSLAELFRARKNRPHAILVTTLGRVGVLGITLAAFYSIPLVLVVSTDTTGAVAHYNAPRVISSGGVKPAVLLLVSRRVRAAFFRRSAHLRQGLTCWSARVAAHCAAALHAEAQELVLLSPKCLELYTAGTGTDAEQAAVTVFPAGIDRLPDSPPPAELVWRPGALRVLYVGRFAPEKGLPVLLRAVRLAVDAGVDAHLTLVGEGPQAGRLASEAARLGIAGRVTMVGPYPRRELGGVYASADVFAFPSIVDTQAFVLNEAAHEGLPLLVSDTANSVVRDGASALVVPPDPAAYAAGLARLCDPRLRERLGAAARQRAAEVSEVAQSRRLAEVLRRAITAVPAHRTGPRAVGSAPADAGSRPPTTPIARPAVRAAELGLSADLTDLSTGLAAGCGTPLGADLTGTLAANLAPNLAADAPGPPAGRRFSRGARSR